MPHFIRRTTLATLVLSLATSAHAENWPQWRGPRGDSSSQETNLPLAWSETSGLAWKGELPEWGTSTPCVWGDSVFLTTQRDDELLLINLSAADGAMRWTRTVGKAETPRTAEKRSVQKFHRL